LSPDESRRRGPLGLGVLALAALGSAGLPADSDAAVPCVVPSDVGEPQADISDTAQEELANGDIVRTDHLKGTTSYRSTRCDSSGGFIESMLVGDIAGPDGKPVSVQLEHTVQAAEGSYRTAFSTYVDPSTPEGAALWNRAGGVEAIDVLPAVGADPEGTSGSSIRGTSSAKRKRRGGRSSVRARAASDQGCSQTDYELEDNWGTDTHTYRINSSTVPTSIPGSPVSVLISGRHTWNNTSNPCGLSDITDYIADYYSDTSAGAPVQDSSNTTTFRYLSGLSCYQTGVVACTYRWFKNGHILESDQVYSQSQSWWGGYGDPTGDYLDLFSYAAHESGHEGGLNHASGDWLTMYPATCYGCIRWRDLGRGDVLGIRALYP